MNITVIQLTVAFSVLGGVASLVLVWALTHTADGCEDDKGFHYDSTGATAPVTEEISPRINRKQFLAS